MASLRERIEKGEYSNQTTGKSVRNQITEENTWSAMNERGNAIMGKAEKEKKKETTTREAETKTIDHSVVAPKSQPSKASREFIANIEPVKKLQSAAKQPDIKVSSPVRDIPAISKVKEFKTNLDKMGMNSTRTAMTSQEKQAEVDTAAKYGYTPAELAKVKAENEIKYKERNEKAAKLDALNEKIRSTPIVGDALKAIEGIPFSRALRQQTMPEKTANEPRVGGLAALAANIAVPLTIPGAGLSGTGMYQQAGNVLQRFAPNLGNTLGGRVANEAIKQVSTGAILSPGATLALNPQASNEELLQSSAYGAGGGLLLGAGGRLLGEGVSALGRQGLNSLFRHTLDTVSNQLPNQPIIASRTPRVGNKPEPIVTPRIDESIPSTASPVTKPLTQDEGIVGGTKSASVPRESSKLDKLYKAEETADKKLKDFYDEMDKKYGKDVFEGWSLVDKARNKWLESETVATYFKRSDFEKKNPGIARTETSEPITTTPEPTRVPETHVNAPIVPEGPVRSSGTRAQTSATQRVSPVDDVEEILQSVQQPRVRDRVASFLDEQEKAALDRISRRKNNLSANPLPEWGDHAIVMAAQLGKGTIKAADFTEELVKRFGESVRPHAQAIYRQSKEVLRQQERRASKEGQEAMAFNESGIGDADTFGSKISTEKAARTVPFKARWEKLRTQLVDDLAPLEGLEKRVTGTVASAEDSLYKSARMFKGVPERAAQTVERRLAPIIESVEKSGHSSSDLGKYALARHAQDVNAAGIKSGFTNAEIESVLTKYGTPEMEAARQQLVKVNKDMMSELVDNGVVSKELAAVLDDRWKNYIPLFRAFDDESVEMGKGLSDALANVASPIKTLKGSNRKVVDPLENMVKNIFQSIQASERNKVASKLHRLNEIDTDNNFIRELKQGEEVGRKNVVNVKVNGENVKYEVEPEVYKALLNLDKESANTLIKIFSKPASLLRAGATLTPEFFLRNPIRDVVQAFVVSKSGFNPITDFGVGIIQSITKGKLYQSWVDNLGSYGNIVSMDRDVHKRALEKVLKEPASKKFVNIINGKSLIRALRAISDTTESATKVGEFRAALRKGVTPQEAAYRSRDIMDFGRAGTSIRQANKIIAFLNANVQGKSKIIRAIKENPVGTITRAFTAVTVPTIGIFMLNKQFANETQNETIDNAPDWMRNSFWLMAIPGTDVVARIPKPFDLATIFSNLPERALDYVYKNDKEAFDGYVRNSLSDASLPFQITGLQPLVEGMAGYSFFREGDITPQREQGLKSEDQYDPVRTTETAKFLSKGLDKITGGNGLLKNFSSPRVMDNTIQGYTAGLGKYATDAIDSILQGMIPFTGKKVAPAIVDRPLAPEKSIEQQPLFRSFLVDPNQGGKIMDKFYSEKDKLTKEKASNKLNEITFGGTKKKPHYLEKDKESTLKSLSDASDDVSGINKQIRTIERDKLMTAKEKRKQIDLLIEKRKLAIEKVMK